MEMVFSINVFKLNNYIKGIINGPFCFAKAVIINRKINNML